MVRKVIERQMDNPFKLVSDGALSFYFPSLKNKYFELRMIKH